MSDLMGGGNRKSNIELLRLVSMIMVLNLHSFWGYSNGSGVVHVFDFFRESASICAVDVFLIISGYFGIKWKFKSFFNLTFQILFYSFGVYLISVELGYIEFSFSDFLKCSKGLYSSWGFITGYILLYFYAPFINAFVEKESPRKILVTIGLLWFAMIFICRDSHYLNYGIMYLIGRFLYKSQAVERLRVNALLGYFSVTIILTIVAYLLYKFTPINNAEAMTSCILTYSYSAPLCILQAIFLFLTFARMEIKSKFINWCSISTLAIFLIHMHPTIKHIGYYSITESFYERSVSEHIGMLILCILTVFCGSILIDQIRIAISKFVYWLILSIKKSIDPKYFDSDTYLPNSIKNIL